MTHSPRHSHEYGSGPNWKIRVIRQALKSLGMDGDLLRHGVSREVYAMPLAENWRQYLTGEANECILRRPLHSGDNGRGPRALGDSTSSQKAGVPGLVS